jgi:hypothetical protein
MAKTKGPTAETDWKQMLSAAVLLVAVFGTLLLGAVLQADPNDPAIADGQVLVGSGDEEVVSSDTIATDENEPDFEPGMAVPFAGDADLVDRAVEDERRLHASGNGYTLQFAVNCEAKNVRANLDALKGYQDFYLLTMLYQDRACFRLCWGFYDTEQQARSERVIPDTLATITRQPKVISIAEALP